MLDYVLYRGLETLSQLQTSRAHIKTMATQMFDGSRTSEPMIRERHTVTR
jgi:hypothetical protein